MKKHIVFVSILLVLCGYCNAQHQVPDWSIAVLPSSVRIDPSTHRIYDRPYENGKMVPGFADAYLQQNWVYDGKKVALQAARGEYVSFQLVITRNTANTLTGIRVAMPTFASVATKIPINPELFLEWSVEVKTGSTAYSTASLGKGWYPDALIPFECIQQDSSPVRNGWVYPLQLPDFNNRIDNQRSQIIWVDQYIPFEKETVAAGKYNTAISVHINGREQSIPVELTVLDFSLPNENTFRASLQHEGFVSSMNEKNELEIYQLMKRNRMSVMDPTYKPSLKKNKGKYELDWKDFDSRLKKYLTGEAFTAKHGYTHGPGYAEPVEVFLLPFDVYGKHGTAGWPDVGTPDIERVPANKATYIDMVQKVRSHLQQMVNPQKTELTIYLNGLDESYFPEAWNRMVYYGNLFKKEYPEAKFRVDGAYNDTAMNIIQDAIQSWAVHTIEFDEKRLQKFNAKGIQQWLYGPMLYESYANSWVGSSTFTDLPLVNDRAISWAAWKYNAHSWISWGIGAGWKAAWYDNETWKSVNDGGNANEYAEKKLNGNALLIYSPGIVPNVKKACPSIRLKMYRDGVQEYEYLRKLKELDQNETRTNQVVNEIIAQPFGLSSIGNVQVWSFDPQQWDNSRLIMGRMIEQTIKGKK